MKEGRCRGGGGRGFEIPRLGPYGDVYVWACRGWWAGAAAGPRSKRGSVTPLPEIGMGLVLGWRTLGILAVTPV